ncbi:MAG: serine/threonine-protein kinase [Acidobacteriota bacterium]|nr:serine/threonine-protein kinase [Acidobacteriota bacterium]
MTERIGRYEIESEIGRGAMGIVYLARDTRLRRRVAVKTYAVPSGLTAEQEHEFRERFEREARAAAALSHPGIVTVYDVDRDGDNGTPFITMEYVEGESLHDLLERRGKLEPAEAIRITAQVADALHAAHAAGIVHRDVKPGNILIRSRDDRIKLADFGVARLRESELTRSGAAVGSPGYMSPEQIRGESIDGRADLFSLGVILYRMLSGRAPFEGDDLPALVYSIAHETPVPITRLVPDLPDGFRKLMDRALAKSPNERFADGHAFHEALSRAMEPDAREPGTKTVVAAKGSSSWTPPMATSTGDRPPRFRIARRIVIGSGLLLAVVLAIAWLRADPAYVEFSGRSTVESGELTLYIDGEEVYSRELAFTGNRNALSKFVDKLRPAAGGETFEAIVKTSSGRHEVEAVLAESTTGEEHRSSVVIELDDRATERLKVIAGKLHGAPLTLKRD